MGMTKGVSTNNYLAFVRARAPGALLERVKAEMDESAREALFSKPLVPSEPVDYGAVVQLLVAADKVVGKGDLALVREAARSNQETNLRGVYRALLPFASTEFIIKMASKLWTRYHDTGSVSVERLGPTKAGLILRDYPGIPRHHAPEIEGAFEGILGVAGTRVERIVHTACVNRGDPLCKWEISWSA
jgi:hypothetical protein